MVDLDSKVKSAAIDQLSFLIGDKNAEYMSRRIVTPEYNVFYAMLPDIINFIDWINVSATGPLCFVSRDGYLLHKIQQVRYPEKKSYYVYSSREAMKTASVNYINYIRKFVQMNGNFVDAHGTNKSHVEFFQAHFSKIPKKYVFVKSATSSYLQNLNYYIPVTEMPKHWGISCDTVEYFLRAPHPSVIDVNSEGKPIHNVYHDVDTVIKRNHSVFIDQLENDYKKLIKLFKLSKNISFVNQYPLLRPKIQSCTTEKPLIIKPKQNPLDIFIGKNDHNKPIIVEYCAI